MFLVYLPTYHRRSRVAMLWKVFLLGLLTAFAVYAVTVLFVFDINKEVYNHRPGPCRQLKGIDQGAEDIALIEDKGLAFITSGIFYMTVRPPSVEGNIFLYDFNHPEKDPLKLPIVGMNNRKDFRPHGISHWQQGEKIRLFVICHSQPNFIHTIEVFDFDSQKKQLNYVKTLKDEKFIRPNNLVALSDEKLIVSNDGTAQTGLMNIIEILTFYKGGSLIYFDGKESHWLKERVVSANGIALDREKKHLLVSHINSKVLGVYKLSGDYKALTEVSYLRLGTAADNLWVDKDNAVWTGAHPVFYKGWDHFSDCENHSKWAPSQILRIKYSPDWKSFAVNEVFMDEGQLLSGSAVAVYFQGKMLAGTVCRQAVVCDVLNKSFD